MRYQNEELKKAISVGLAQMVSQQELSADIISDMLEKPYRTFFDYLHGNSTPTLEFILKLCNRFQYPLNSIFETIITSSSTEQKYVMQLHTLVQNLSEINQNKLKRIITPIVESMTEGFPLLYDADFGSKICILRKDQKLSVKDLAERCQVSERTLKQLESKQRFPSLDTLYKICSSLRVSPEYIMTKELIYLCQKDKVLYSLTPRQLKGLSKMVNLYCISFL